MVRWGMQRTRSIESREVEWYLAEFLRFFFFLVPVLISYQRRIQQRKTHSGNKFSVSCTVTRLQLDCADVLALK